MAIKGEHLTASIIGVFGLAATGGLVWLWRGYALNDEVGWVLLGLAAVAGGITVLLVGSTVIHSAKEGTFPKLRAWWPRFHVPATSPVQLILWIVTAVIIGLWKGCNRLD